MQKVRFDDRDEIYKHYKGGFYALLYEAKHTETQEDMVVYRDEYFNIWVRPSEMFYGTVEVDGKKLSRFTKCQ